MENNKKWKYIKYTLDHRKAFIKVEKELLGKNSIRGMLHDLDKVFIKMFISDGKKVQKIHRKFSKHHELRAESERDFEQMVIDWECARITKPDKPLDAYDTLYKFYPHLEKEILPILKRMGISHK